MRKEKSNVSLALWSVTQTSDQSYVTVLANALGRYLKGRAKVYAVLEGKEIEPDRQHYLFIPAWQKNDLALRLLNGEPTNTDKLLLWIASWKGVFWHTLPKMLGKEDNNPHMLALAPPPLALDDIAIAAWDKQWDQTLSILLSFGRNFTPPEMCSPVCSVSDRFLWKVLAECKGGWSSREILCNLAFMSCCSTPKEVETLIHDNEDEAERQQWERLWDTWNWFRVLAHNRMPLDSRREIAPAHLQKKQLRVWLIDNKPVDAWNTTIARKVATSESLNEARLPPELVNETDGVGSAFTPHDWGKLIATRGTSNEWTEPDIVLVDYFLEKSGMCECGDALLPDVLEAHPTAIVLGFSVSLDPDVLHLFSQKGADGFIRKNRVDQLASRYLSAQRQLSRFADVLVNKTLGEIDAKRCSDLGRTAERIRNLVKVLDRRQAGLFFGNRMDVIADHGYRHTRNVWNLVDSFLAAQWELASSPDAAMKIEEYAAWLTVATWLHDIGMRGNPDCQEPEKVRESHGKISKDLVLRLWSDLWAGCYSPLLPNESVHKVDDAMRQGVAWITVAHQGKVVNKDDGCLLSQSAFRDLCETLPHLIPSAVVLRVADALDCESERVGTASFDRLKRCALDDQLEAQIRCIVALGDFEDVRIAVSWAECAMQVLRDLSHLQKSTEDITLPWNHVWHESKSDFLQVWGSMFRFHFGDRLDSWAKSKVVTPHLRDCLLYFVRLMQQQDYFEMHKTLQHVRMLCPSESDCVVSYSTRPRRLGETRFLSLYLTDLGVYLTKHARDITRSCWEVERLLSGLELHDSVGWAKALLYPKLWFTGDFSDHPIKATCLPVHVGKSDLKSMQREVSSEIWGQLRANIFPVQGDDNDTLSWKLRLRLTRHIPVILADESRKLLDCVRAEMLTVWREVTEFYGFKMGIKKSSSCEFKARSGLAGYGIACDVDASVGKWSVSDLQGFSEKRSPDTILFSPLLNLSSRGRQCFKNVLASEDKESVYVKTQRLADYLVVVEGITEVRKFIYQADCCTGSLSSTEMCTEWVELSIKPQTSGQINEEIGEAYALLMTLMGLWNLRHKAATKFDASIKQTPKLQHVLETLKLRRNESGESYE